MADQYANDCLRCRIFQILIFYSGMPVHDVCLVSVEGRLVHNDRAKVARKEEKFRLLFRVHNDRKRTLFSAKLHVSPTAANVRDILKILSLKNFRTPTEAE